MGQIGLTFDHTISNEEIKELSVVSYTDSFFYGLWNTKDQLLKTGYHPHVSLESVISLCQYHYNIEKVKRLSAVKPYVHLPSKEVEDQYFDIYFNGLFKIERTVGNSKTEDKFIGHSLSTLHYTNEKVDKLIEAYPWQYKKAHMSTAMANYCHLENAELVCFIANNVMHITLLDEDGFKLYNQYDCYYTRDYLYYLMLVMNAFELNPLKARVNIGGDISSDSEVFTLFANYVKHLHFVDEQLEYKSTDWAVPKSHYYDLYLCKTCV